MDPNSAGTEEQSWKPFTGQIISLTPAEKNMIAGGVAGCIGKTITAPLSRLTVLSQVSSLFPKDHPHHSAMNGGSKQSLYGTLRSIVKTQGVLSLWNGNWTSVLHRFPYSAINFAVFEATNDYLTKVTDKSDTTTNRFMAGALSGATACFACYPLDLVRTRLTVSSSFSSPAGAQTGSKIYHVVKEIILKEGVGGLYRGLPVSLFVTAPTLAISFSIYGLVKGKLIALGGMFTYNNNNFGENATPKQKLQNANHLTPIGSLCAGCLSGIASSCAIFPVDVVRKRMQVMGQLVPLNNTTAAVAAEVSGAVPSAEAALQINIESPTGATKWVPRQLPSAHDMAPKEQHVLPNSANTFQQARHIFRTEGLRGFYRGITPELLKVCPMVAVMYCSYEIVQDALNLHFPSPSK
mmetsp:Transcript_117313/g.230127  ORF Transcript_117313/g.230127 Transcript_117313/m.230127 type:complete len:408 (+) Transcript_117313:135-1358(+)|eukprot:CAMPEP_0170379238 /NCGR_PEP_ID=MMETSP0117_2-20130122/13234_1 /TAXON_ID=400756 /ORGANISM="Durinskia baltica, Strain CSIRO CS-38" /LENGTH=407 /DNA_ID=CAMNT_0010634659 /DNA_START=117 /DNA_END=1340 /DNA_ORIENTATION=-